jgi:hydroxyacylglutathione hydrolase
MLKHRTRDEFVSAVLADLPETPQYFARMKRVNQHGPPLLRLADGYAGVPAIQPVVAAAAIQDGAVLIDLRPAEAFSSEHPDGAINLAFGASVGYWAGWVVPAESAIVLIAAGEREASEVGRQLLRVGLDSVAGFVENGIEGWRSAGLPLTSIPQISAYELHARRSRGEPITIVDVRTPLEWRRGHIDGSVHLPVGEIPARASELPRDVLLVTICEGGYRSSLAASLLARARGAAVANVPGGMAAYRAAVIGSPPIVPSA